MYINIRVILDVRFILFESLLLLVVIFVGPRHTLRNDDVCSIRRIVAVEPDYQMPSEPMARNYSIVL